MDERLKGKLIDRFRAKSSVDINSQEFLKWFGDWENSPETSSKIVDKSGQPLLVKHIASQKIEQFDKSKIGSRGLTYGTGFYFSSLDWDANYGNFEHRGYLNIKNPFKVKVFSEDVATQNYFYDLLKQFPNAEELRGLYEEFLSNEVFVVKYGPEKFTKLLKEQGYDGVLVEYENGDTQEAVAFEPEQIKLTETLQH